MLFRSDARLHAGRRQVDLAAERLQHVGAAAGAGHRPITVLGDADARAGGDEGRGGADVEDVLAAAAGAAGVQQRPSEFDVERLTGLAPLPARSRARCTEGLC